MGKTCKKCNTEKELDDFYDRKDTKDHKANYCKSCMNDITKIYQHTHRAKCNEIKRNQYKDPLYKIAHYGRTQIRCIIRDTKPCYKFLVISGAGSRAKLMKHLKSTIPMGYTWKDYGVTLCVDHIIPCSKFNLSDPKEFAVCFNYMNLRIVTKEYNYRKYDNIEIMANKFLSYRSTNFANWLAKGKQK